MSGDDGRTADAGRHTTNVLMAGVGGQGVLVASETLALAALADGLEAKQSEVHGVAQRGGSVVSHVRFGARVHAPLITCGDADFLCAAERLEAARYAHYLKSGGAVLMDDRAIKPLQLPDEPERPYPENVDQFLRSRGHDVQVIPALQTAVDLGEQRCANVILLGALASRLDLSEEAWQEALERRLPAKVLELNRRAFAAGRELAVPVTAVKAKKG
jgi:indolepyruvate ferredoxin oxidoreductase beta subunit